LLESHHTLLERIARLKRQGSVKMGWW